MSSLLDPFVYEAAVAHQADLRQEAHRLEARRWLALLSFGATRCSGEERAHPCLIRLLLAPR